MEVLSLVTLIPLRKLLVPVSPGCLEKAPQILRFVFLDTQLPFLLYSTHPEASSYHSASEALKFLGIKKMPLYTPTTEEITLQTKKYLEDQGFTVVAHKSVGVGSFREANRISPFETLGDVMKLYRQNSDVDGIFICGACLRALEILSTLEEDTGLPSVYTKTANVWKCLQLAGVKERVFGFGKLLEMPR